MHRQSVWAEWMPRRRRWWWSVPALPQRWQRQASRESTASLIQLAIILLHVEEFPVDLPVPVEPIFRGLPAVVCAAGEQCSSSRDRHGDHWFCGCQFPIVQFSRDTGRPVGRHGDEGV